MSEVKCPRCQNLVFSMQSIDSLLIEKLRENGNTEVLPPQVCDNCFNQLFGGIARGSLLMAKEKAKDQKKIQLWKSRVSLIKKARIYMQEKMYGDAAVIYEKYLKVLELVFEVKSEQLSPQVFRETARTQELTVVASVYWDLIKIYDTNDKYTSRQSMAVQKLTEFLKFTPIYPDIIRKAQIFQRSAKHPEQIGAFLKAVNADRGRCFIATAVYNDSDAWQVEHLRKFRDQKLETHFLGKKFVSFYYSVSPTVASLVIRHPWLQKSIRTSFDLFITQKKT